MKFGKHTLLCITAIVLAIIVATETFIIVGFNHIYNKFVVTNSYDRRFDPKQFRFEHYSSMARNEHQINPALLRMLPPGTDKAYVDQILVTQAHARASTNQLSKYHNEGDKDVTYSWGSWLVRFIFDKSDKAALMKTGNKPFYGIDPIDTFWKEKAHEREQ